MAVRVGAVAGAGAVATASVLGSRVAAQSIKALWLAAREEHLGECFKRNALEVKRNLFRSLKVSNRMACPNGQKQCFNIARGAAMRKPQKKTAMQK